MAAPISETAGRNVVYITTFPIFMLFTMRRVLRFIRVTSGVPLLCRFLWRACHGFRHRKRGRHVRRPVAVCWHSSIHNVALFWSLTRISVNSPLSTLTQFNRNTGALNGPIVGGFVAEHKDWRRTQWTILFGALPIYLMTLCIPKTYQKTLMKRRAKQRGLPLPPKEYEGAAAITFLISITLIRPVHMLRRAHCPFHQLLLRLLFYRALCLL
ncbi:hypothetical protein JOL62DRAFT_388079 [Phyllosticta paracitricarpa]|uniref:Uncharacterized protein n=1 Tax=Phyllosticta paracitricarpa TaxID=2016321 RepID=A0ABR1NHZ5_9PEZI